MTNQPIDESLFSDALIDQIADGLVSHKYCILDSLLSNRMSELLYQQALQDAANFKPAGVGRGQDHQLDRNIRGDEIRWIEEHSDAEQWWLNSMDALRKGLNQRLYLGLHEFESHYAHYPPGAYYEKHVDAFVGQSNRILSTVTYLNRDWKADYGGELVLYDQSGENELSRVLPNACKMVIFMSEGMPHQVLPALEDRYSIAGWFRIQSLP